MKSLLENDCFKMTPGWSGVLPSTCPGFLRGRNPCRNLAAVLMAVFLLLPWPKALGGTWTPLANLAPGGIGTMLLLTDGTVLAQNGSGTAWCRLTPDIHGSYVNGTWSSLASMSYTRLYYSSDVLRDGRVLIAGAEYGTGTNSAEVYDPVGNTWTTTPPPPAGQVRFFDSISKILPNGNVLVSPVGPATYGGTVIYSPVTNTWSVGPTLYRGGYQDEATWVKLPDDSILTVDPFGTSSERYIPSLNKWINDSVLPVALYDPYLSEEGASFLLPNGKAIFFGSTGHTAIYTPTGTTNAGAWTAGPDIPNSQGTPDAPAAMMVNGVILCAVSPVPTSTTFTTPTSFYEYDPVANAFAQVNGPTGSTLSGPSYNNRMLDLPDGTVLFTDYGNLLYVYQPSSGPLASGKPAITGVTTNNDGTYHLSGTLLNGISEGAGYGDDAQMNSNYPLIRMTNAVGNVYYARTFNWSSTGVMTGSTPESTDFTVPAGLPVGTYSLVVVANGISSDPVSFTYVPDALQFTPLAGFNASGPNGGPFNVTSQSFALTNYGAASLNWSVINTSLWLNVSPGSGTLTPGGPAATVLASLNANASNLTFGTYTANVWFTNLNSHYAQSRQFTLSVLPPQLVQNGGFETGDFTSWTLNGGGNPDNFVDNGGSWSITPHSGSYFALLGQAGGLAYLSQTLPTTAGQTYLLSCWFNSPDGLTPNEFNVAWNGTTLFDQLNIPAIASPGWTNLLFLVSATGPGTVLQFGAQDDTSYLGLDDVSVVPVPPTLFQSTVKTGGAIQFTWNTVPGLVYQLQYKTNLAQANWVNLGGQVPATGATATTSDLAPADPQRFYHLIVLP